MTNDERLRILRAPLSVGLLASTRYGGRSSAGGGTFNKPTTPVMGRHGFETGRRAVALQDQKG